MDKVDESDSVVHFTVNLGLLHTLARHWVIADDFRECCSREVFLAGLLFCAVLSRVLVHWLETVCFTAKLVMCFLEELA